MTRVCLDVSSAMLQSAGIARYARELTLALQRLPDAPELSLFHNAASLDRMPLAWHNLPRSEVPLGNKAWRLFLLTGLRLPNAWSRVISQSQVFHGLDYIIPSLSQPTVMTVHDLTALRFPEYHSLFNRAYQCLALPIMLRRASAILTDALCTKEDLQNFLHVPAQKITVTPLGIDHSRFKPHSKLEAQNRVSTEFGVQGPFILGLGTLEPRKNLVGLLHAFAELSDGPEQLVLVGASGWGDVSPAQLAESMGLSHRVKFTGFVHDDLLPILYSAAACFVYPSFYEGFGLPVLEAMACGAAVITSNTSSLPEVAGDAALLVSPSDTKELVAAIRRLLQDTTLVQKLSEAGQNRAKRFSWERTARETLGVYQSLV